MNREEARKKAEALVDAMTIEEMASQLKYNSPAIEHLGVEEYNWWSEGLHGVARAGTATVFPQAIGMAAAFDDELLEEVATVVSVEARAKYNENKKRGDKDIYKGLTLWSPNVNIFRDPRWGRGHETYGEDPYLTSRMGAAYVKGLQGTGEHLRVAACAKHFAVHSGPEGLRHSFDVYPSKKDMYETYLPAFETCVKEAKVESVMGAYNRVNGQPACASTELQSILRDDWGFEGHFVSDCWAIRDFHENHKVTKDFFESAALALKNGCDVNCGCTYEYIMYAYEKGLIDKEDIRKSAIRLFTTRFLLGMEGESEYDALDYMEVEKPKHIALSRKMAEKTIVMLKNDGILPVKKAENMVIGVVGPNANNRLSLIGNYHGTASRYVTVLDAIKEEVEPKGRVLYSSGCHLFKDREEDLAKANDRLAEALTVCEHSDLVVLCLGLDETLEGEEGDTGNSYASGDKEDLLLPESQRKLLDSVISTGKPFILCMMAGSAIDMSLAQDKAAAILQCWYPGTQGGYAVSDIIFGKVSPSGKLPLSFYYNEDLKHMPDFEDYSMRGRTYRYIDREPLYPFGYGLTYADVRVTDAKVISDEYSLKKAAADGLDIEIGLENVSEIFTDEVVQVYIRLEGATDEVKNHRLCAFKRVSLSGKEKKSLKLHINKDAFLVVDTNGNRVAQGSRASLFVGFGQPDKRTVQLSGNECLEINI